MMDFDRIVDSNRVAWRSYSLRPQISRARSCWDCPLSGRHMIKFCFILLALLLAESALAGNVILFDSPYLVGYQDASGVSGFYSATDGQVSCAFLFFEASDERLSRQKVGYFVRKIKTFVPGDQSFAFIDRNKSFDIGGYIYADKNSWVLRTSTPQAGCGNAEGVFEFDPPDIRAEHYSIVKTIPALGIRMVRAKTFFYDLRAGSFARRKGFLVRWNGVVVLQVRGAFSYVRYSDAKSNSDGRVTTGWVYSADLVDPFPVADKR